MVEICGHQCFGGDPALGDLTGGLSGSQRAKVGHRDLQGLGRKGFWSLASIAKLVDGQAEREAL